MIIVLITVGIVRYLIWLSEVQDLAYASLYTFTRIDGICIGCILAILMKANPSFLKKYTTLIVLLMAAINFGFYFINNQLSKQLPYLAFVGYTTFAVLFGILVYEAALGESPIIRTIFTNRILKFFGHISYGLYVYHWPVYFLLFPFFQKILFENGHLPHPYSEAGSAVIVTTLSVLLSLLSYHYFEKRFLQLKKRYD